MMKRISRTIIVLLLCGPPFLISALSQSEVDVSLESIRAEDLYGIVRVLTAEDMEGRLSGTQGYDRAAEWAAGQFKTWGVKPAFREGYFQSFTVDFNEMHETRLSLATSSKDTQSSQEVKFQEMALYRDFSPTLYSGFGDVKSEVVFVGFGITDEVQGWDDYQNLDVKGKIVAVFRGSPEIEGKNFTLSGKRRTKILNAASHQAAGMIILNRYPVIAGSGPHVPALPIVIAGDGIAEKLFAARGFDLKTVKSKLGEGQPFGFVTGVQARLMNKGIHHSDAPTANVVGMVEGSDPLLKKECIIFGAHLDHLGKFPFLHPGAVDNAGGVAVVMQLARSFSNLKKKPKRSLLFVLFGAEELGLIGSRFMVERLSSLPFRPVLMVNNDVVANGRELRVFGDKNYGEFFDLMEEEDERHSINGNLTWHDIQKTPGNSDYAPFYKKGIPTYTIAARGFGVVPLHTPMDTLHMVTPRTMEDLTRLYFAAGFRYADR